MLAGDREPVAQPPADIVAAVEPLVWREEPPTVPEVAPFVRALYAIHPAGGSLHIVLDDYNVKDDDVAHCVEWAQEQGDRFGELLARVILRMSRTQRVKLTHCKR